MKSSRRYQRELRHHGEFPDGGWGNEPDILPARRAINSGMSAITEPGYRPSTEVETKWDEVIFVVPQSNSFSSAPAWRPAVNAYRCIDEFVIFVDLAGVPPESIELSAEPGRLIIRGLRPAPEPACRRSDLAQLLALEIDQGTFERVLDLPHTIDPERIETEYRDGLYQIQLPLRR